MNKEVEEIKENLDFAREVFDYTLNPDQCGLLLDYINQLEEELKYTVPIVEHNKIVSEKLKENQQLQQKVNQLEEKEELHLNCIDELTDRVVKLEINRDEAIELNKKINNLVAFGDSENKLPDLVWELSSILERGKE